MTNGLNRRKRGKIAKKSEIEIDIGAEKKSLRLPVAFRAGRSRRQRAQGPML
jgi:hypothetical protein